MKLTINKDYSGYSAWIKMLPQDFNHGELVHDGRNVIRKFNLGDAVFIVKRYRVPNPVQRLSYSIFRPSKARRAYEYAFEFLKRGIMTPDPVAYIEMFHGGFLAYSYFVSTECVWPEVRSVLPKEGEFSTGVADAFAAYLAGMQRAGVFHGDLNLGNFMFNKDKEGKYLFCAVDINRSRFVDMDLRNTAKSLCRLSHRRDMFEYIVRRCAEARGMDPELLMEESINCLDSFEKKNALKRKLKSFFKRSKR